MSEMLTAREVQALLQVDRSTIYRMAEDGRLPAIKVGKQWRFPADRIQQRFDLPDLVTGTAQESQSSTPMPAPGNDLAGLLPLDCVQLIQDTYAELLGVMLVVTDMNGRPITRPSHTCGLFDVISQKPDALQRCIYSWHSLAVAIDLEPRFSRSHLGLLCCRAMIRVGAELKGMVVAGCVAPDDWPPFGEELAAMAAEFGVATAELDQHLHEVFILDGAARQRVLGNVQRIANVMAHIVNERLVLVKRLNQIADLANL